MVALVAHIAWIEGGEDLLAVLRGSKRVTLFPPSDEPRLRPAVLLDVQSSGVARGDAAEAG